MKAQLSAIAQTAPMQSDLEGNSSVAHYEPFVRFAALLTGAVAHAEAVPAAV